MTIISKYIVGGILGVIVLGVFLLSSGVVNPSWNPFKQPPSGDILQTAIYSLSQVEKMSIKGNGNMKIVNEKSSNYLKNPLEKTDQSLIAKQIELALAFNQFIDYSVKENKKNSTDFNISLGIEGMELSMGAKIIGVDKNLFLNISSLPPYLPLGIDVETIKNQWLLIDSAKLGLFGVANDLPAEQIAENENQILIASLKQLVNKKSLFKIKKELKPENVDNEQASHYLATVDKNNFKKLFPEIMNLLVDKLPESQKQAYQQNLQNTLTDFDQNFDAIWKQFGGIEFEVWINSNNILKKIKFAKEIQGSSVDFEVIFSDFGKDVVIEAPTEYKPIEQVLPAELLGISTSTQQTIQ
mgnify:CR=1 FL=1